MIIDCHTHIFPPFIRDNREPLIKADSAFRLLYDSAKARLAGAAELVEQMDRSGVNQTVVFGFPWSDPVFPGAIRNSCDATMTMSGKQPAVFRTASCPLFALIPERSRRLWKWSAVWLVVCEV
jgi:hypothetical protein